MSAATALVLGVLVGIMLATGVFAALAPAWVESVVQETLEGLGERPARGARPFDRERVR